jgi:hypothetical protein
MASAEQWFEWIDRPRFRARTALLRRRPHQGVRRLPTTFSQGLANSSDLATVSALTG